MPNLCTLEVPIWAHHCDQITHWQIRPILWKNRFKQLQSYQSLFILLSNLWKNLLSAILEE